MCGCSMYFMPQLSNTSIVCGKSHADCIEDAIKSFAMKPNETYKCKCLPSCWDITYSTSFSLTPIFGTSDVAQMTGISSHELAVMSIFFDKSYFRSNRKEPTLTFTTFLCKQPRSHKVDILIMRLCYSHLFQQPLEAY